MDAALIYSRFIAAYFCYLQLLTQFSSVLNIRARLVYRSYAKASSMQDRKRTCQSLDSTSKRMRRIVSVVSTNAYVDTTGSDHGSCLACEALNTPLHNDHDTDQYPSRDPVSSYYQTRLESVYASSAAKYPCCALLAAFLEPYTAEYSHVEYTLFVTCLLYTSPSPRDGLLSRMPSSA